MKNWRGTLTTILRSAGGESHLSEIYPEVEILGKNLGQEWKAVARGNLERIGSNGICFWDGWSGRTRSFGKTNKDPKRERNYRRELQEKVIHSFNILPLYLILSLR